MKDFSGRVAAITGAGSGIGRALANALARQGAHLALSDIDDAGLAETVAQCEGFGVKITSAHVDVADRGAVYAWADRVVAEHGKVNLIINNAGVALAATVESMSYDDFEWLMNIDFWGVVYGTKAFLPHLKLSGEGHIVNLSSVFGLISVPSQSAYNAAKFAVRGFTDTLRMELEIEGANVSVTTVHPGGIKTNIARNARMDPSVRDIAADPEEAAQDFERAFITSPEKAAEQILTAVRRDRRRALIGPDAKAIDLVSRLPAGIYQAILTRGACLPEAYAFLITTALRTAAEAVERRADRQPPSSLDRLRRGPEPPSGFGERHALNQRNQDVRHVRLVTAQSARFDAPSHPADNQDADRARRRQLVRPRREIREGSGEHDFGQIPVGPDESAVGGGQGPEIRDRILALSQRSQCTKQLPEALEVELSDDPRLVSEQLVERRSRGLGAGSQRPCREPSCALFREKTDGGGECSAAQLRGALLRAGHQEVLEGPTI